MAIVGPGMVILEEMVGVVKAEEMVLQEVLKGRKVFVGVVVVDLEEEVMGEEMEAAEMEAEGMVAEGMVVVEMVAEEMAAEEMAAEERVVVAETVSEASISCMFVSTA